MRSKAFDNSSKRENIFFKNFQRQLKILKKTQTKQLFSPPPPKQIKEVQLAVHWLLKIVVMVS